MKQAIRNLYFGKSRSAKLFRYGLLAFDVVTVAFFIYSTVADETPFIYLVDLIIAAILIADLGVRLWISERTVALAFDLSTLLDVFVILSLLLAPFVSELLFLRVIRALRLLQSYRVLNDLRNELSFFRRNEEVILSAVNLFVFVFIMTALVYVFQKDINPQVSNYIDALYFTVTALTTTGFGDVVLKDTSGRLLSVIIMVVGVALFLRMVQTIFRPAKAHFVCPGCGLSRHDPDAVHCKHCGRLIHIETEGQD